MRELVFATHNKNKLTEISQLLGKEFKIISLSDLKYFNKIPENEKTLEENAFVKANTIYKQFDKDCFADDTGLEVEALNSRPGVLSARYAGDEKNPIKNIEKLLIELRDLRDWSARFRTIICLIEKGTPSYFEGIVEGKIINTLKGSYGFGYDPIFVPKGYSFTFAEMELKEKNKISHRAIALKKLITHLKRPRV